MGKRSARRVAVGLLLLCGAPLGADSFAWDQSGIAPSASDLQGYVSADDFVIVEETRVLRAVAWIQDGAENNNGLLDHFDGVLGWAVYADANGTPGSLRDFGVGTSLVLTDQGSQDGTHDILRVAFDLSPAVTLEPGTFWLALREGVFGDPADDDQVLWQSALPAQGATSKAYSLAGEPEDWVLNGIDLAFVLFGTPAAFSEEGFQPGGEDFNISAFVTAEDFTLAAPASFAAADLWLHDDDGPFDGFSGTLGWTLYDATGTGGGPGSTIATGHDSAPALAPTIYGSLSGAHIVRARFAFDRSISLAAGTYWLALHEGEWGSAYDSSTVFWVFSGQPIGPGTKQGADLVTPAWETSNDDDVGLVLFEELLFASGFEHDSACAWTGLSGLACD